MPSDRRRYEVREPVGKGGFGTVYDAQLLGVGGFSKRVALKVLRDKHEFAEEIAQRQRDEARILGLIRHRAVVNVDGLVRLDGRWTVVMEFIDGLNLGQVLMHGKVPPSVALSIVGEVAGALHVAFHTQGPDGRSLKLLHRDIKPGNVTVTTAGEVKVLDFGVARADFDTREAKTRAVRFGSMGYMAPERLTGQDSAAGDIYALGVLLWEMLYGQRFGRQPLGHDKHDERTDRQVGLLPEAIDGPTEGIAALLREMLAFEPEERPTGREVERRCSELLRQVSGPPLRDWAEHILGNLGHERKPVIDEEGLSGQVLTEGAAESDGPGGYGGMLAGVLSFGVLALGLMCASATVGLFIGGLL